MQNPFPEKRPNSPTMKDFGTHIVAATSQHTHTIVFLHGRGSNACEFESEFFESQASDGRFLTQIFPGMKWVFPCAAMRYAQTEHEDMHQWFDMTSVREPSRDQEQQLQGLRESVEFIWDIMKKEADEVGGINKVFLGGISQGCATAIIALLAGGVRIAGFVGLSSWLPLQTSIRKISTDSPKASVKRIRELLYPADHKNPSFQAFDLQTGLQTPILLEHALNDDVLSSSNGYQLCEELRALGMDIEWRAYAEGAHWVNEPNGIDDMIVFLKRNQDITFSQD